ncbi:nuclear transport factor 2 family protein [Streptomyces sp. NPDC026673]|uniref:nuclear transport factor 2 family protein n=1 Tax=Streptomyces sp. NPDC026673 TaxID=3155724 RepID=UPI0034039326
MSATGLRPIPTADLPEVVTRYLAAHRVRDTATAITAFTGDAVVTDEGATRRGTAAIEEWLATAASEYTYTTELTGAERADARHYVAVQHLEGDFPGGTVDLRYRFTLRDGLIERLEIGV